MKNHFLIFIFSALIIFTAISCKKKYTCTLKNQCTTIELCTVENISGANDTVKQTGNTYCRINYNTDADYNTDIVNNQNYVKAITNVSLSAQGIVVTSQYFNNVVVAQPDDVESAKGSSDKSSHESRGFTCVEQ